jgi:hypothetical protein
VQEAQVRVAEAWPAGAWIDTNDLNDAPGGVQSYYETIEGFEKMGQRFAEELIYWQCDKNQEDCNVR